jgi:hypothetical protein
MYKWGSYFSGIILYKMDSGGHAAVGAASGWVRGERPYGFSLRPKLQANHPEFICEHQN